MGLFTKSDPETVEVLGKPLRCQVCSNTIFWRRRAQLHASVATFFNLDWARPRACASSVAPAGMCIGFSRRTDGRKPKSENGATRAIPRTASKRDHVRTRLYAASLQGAGVDQPSQRC